MADFADALRVLEAVVDETLDAHCPVEGAQVRPNAKPSHSPLAMPVRFA